MDHINEGTFDHMVESAIRFEPLEELPVDFSQLFLEQVKAEKPKFQVLNLVDLISSIIIAITIGTAFLIFAFLPEQLNPDCIQSARDHSCHRRDSILNYPTCLRSKRNTNTIKQIQRPKKLALFILD